MLRIYVVAATLAACSPARLEPIDTRPLGPNVSGPDIPGLNHRGVEAYRARKFAEASALFHEAVARDGGATYFFNLCLSLGAEGKRDDACAACERAAADPAVVDRVHRQRAAIGCP